MASEWSFIPLDSLVDDILDRRGVTVRKLGSDFAASGHRVISAKLIKSGTIDLTVDEPRFVDDSVYRRWMHTPLVPGDVILTSEAPLGEVAYVREELDWCLGQRLFAIRTDRRRLDGRFLYYALQSDAVRRDLLSRATGTTAEGIRQSELRRVRIPVPPLEEQKRIAQILGALDDKIELNRRMSQTLESMARALFKSWFIDFDPVRTKANGRGTSLPLWIADLFPGTFEGSELGEIPKGWRVGSIGSIADVVDCSHAKKPDRRENGRLLLQLTNIRSDGVLDTSDKYLIDAADYEAWTVRIEASPGDCVITNVGRVGAVAQIPAGVTAALGRNMTAVRCRRNWAYPTFLVEALRCGAMLDEISRKTDAGTILDALNVRSIPSLRVVVPSQGVLAGFEGAARPVRAAMESLEQQRGSLQNLRDALLPILLSGQLPTSTATYGAVRAAS